MNDIKRAVAVCRCSTEEESQREALQQQVREAKQAIADNGWDLVDMYVEAKSGTSTKGRVEYARLLRDMDEDKFDIIVIKSLDRLMRNTKDWYIFLDKMQKCGKQLYMYIERKFYTPDDALITGIKAILAEEYSRELSKKIKNAHKHRQVENGHLIITNSTLGYMNNEKKETVINPDDVPMVKRIFELVAQGYGSTIAARILTEEGFKAKKGGPVRGHIVQRVVRNPIYMGTAILNKHKFDFETKRYICTTKDEWIIRENAVEPIVSKELFELANQQMSSRSYSQQNINVPHTYATFSGIMKCGLCGRNYRRFRLVHRQNAKWGNEFDWRCAGYEDFGRTPEYRGTTREVGTTSVYGCDNVHIRESRLYDELEKLCEDIFKEYTKESITEKIADLLKQVIDGNEFTDEIDQIQNDISKYKQQKDVLLDKLLDEVISDGMFKEKTAAIDEKIKVLDARLKDLEKKQSYASNVERRLKSIEGAISEDVVEKAKVEEFIKCITKIEVFTDHIEVHINQFKYIGIYELGDEGGDIIKSVSTEFVGAGVKNRIRHDINHILNMMRKDPKVTMLEMSKEIGIPKDRVRRRINILKDEGIVKRIGDTINGHWEVIDKID